VGGGVSVGGVCLGYFWVVCVWGVCEVCEGCGGVCVGVWGVCVGCVCGGLWGCVWGVCVLRGLGIDTSLYILTCRNRECGSRHMFLFKFMKHV
jgi:hypothetical protein